MERNGGMDWTGLDWNGMEWNGRINVVIVATWVHLTFDLKAWPYIVALWNGLRKRLRLLYFVC